MDGILPQLIYCKESDDTGPREAYFGFPTNVFYLRPKIAVIIEKGGNI